MKCIAGPARGVHSRTHPADEIISARLKSFNVDIVHARWGEALKRREEYPEGAITIARTLLEDVCNWILEEAGEADVPTNDLPALYRRLAKKLNLAPDGHTEAVFKKILGSCQQVVEQLGALRNRASDAHSSGPRRVKPKSRHAELAVNLSGAMATFLVATWEDMKAKEDAEKTPPKRG